MSGRVMIVDWQELADTMARISPPPADAYKPSTRVVMVKPEAKDLHKIGDEGTVKACVYEPKLGLAYFIEWDNLQGIVGACMGWKVARVSTSC